MNGKRITLLAIAVVAIGIFALPGTVSLFSGQHAWYDISGAPNDVPCEKYHADIAEEMQSEKAVFAIAGLLAAAYLLRKRI